MNARAQSVVNAALELPKKTRAEVVREILESLEETTDHDAEKHWAKEIARRTKDALAGVNKGPTVSNAFREARRVLKSKK